MKLPDNIRVLLLQCAQHAIRPLRLLELADALSTAGVLGDEASPAAAKETVRKVCVYPIQLSDDETIELIEPPADTNDKSEAEAHLHLARICAAHLASGDLVDITKTSAHYSERLRKAVSSRPFASYAVDHCLSHVEAAVSVATEEDAKALYVELDKALAIPNVVTTLFANFQMKENLARRVPRKQPTESKRRPSWPPPRDPHASSDCLRNGLPTPIQLATCTGLLGYSRWILQNHKPDLGDGLFSHLCAAADKEMIELLLAYGAKLDDTCRDGYGPVHHAVQCNKVEVFETLMDGGGDLLAKSKPSEHLMDWSFEPVTPLRNAGNANRDMTKQVLHHVQNPKHLTYLLINAVKAGNVEGVPAILEDPRVEINAHNDPDHQSRTPLYHACASRDVEMMACLLKAGASTQPPNGVSTWDKDKVDCWPKPIPLVYIPPLHAYANSGDLIQHPWKEVDFHTKRVPREPFSRKAFNLLLAHGASVHQVDSRQNTALHHASDPNAVRHLIKAGVDYNAVNDQGKSFFSAPADDYVSLNPRDKEPVLAGLDFVGGLVDFTLRDSKKGRTPLLGWLACGEFQVAMRMLELGADARATVTEGHGAFHLALENPQIPKNRTALRVTANSFKPFVDEEADPDETRSTPQEPPKETDFNDIAKALARHGADVNLANNKGKTPFHVIMQSKNRDVSKELLPALVEVGADLEKRDVNGRTPLFQMLMDSRDKELCRIMVNAGAKVNISDVNGRPLIFEAAKSPDLLTSLVDLGADPHVRDKNGNTLWHEAAANPIPFGQTLASLKSLGLSPRERNAAGRTPLHLASWIIESTFSGERGPVVTNSALEHFLKEDIDVNAADDAGITPLHVAIMGHEYAVVNLLEAGADASLVTNDELNVLHIAAALVKGNALGTLIHSIKTFRGEEFLIDFVNRKDVLGRTPLYYACASGRLETVQKLIDIGAEIQSEEFEGSCWDGCSAFEGPELSTLPTGEDIRNERVFSTSILIPQNLRMGKYLLRDGFRLNDILDLLWSHDTGAPHLWDAMLNAGKRGDGYVLECLRRLDIWDYDLTDDMKEALTERKRNLLTKTKQCCDEHYNPLFDLLRKKDHIGLKKWAGERDLASLDHTKHGERIFHDLISAGNWMLLRDITWMTPEVLARVELQLLREKPTRENKRFLALACESRMPNMGTVRLLVEALNRGFEMLNEPDKMAECMDAAAHTCVNEGYWWQLYEALPYLIQQGANINAPDSQGRPVLFENVKRYFDHDLDGLKHLLNLGYDPTLPDPKNVNSPGYTLLTRAGNNVALIELLMERGCVVTQSDFRITIQNGNNEGLRAMLDNGADPNTRYQHPQIDDFRATVRRHEQNQFQGEGYVNINDMFPLHYVATVPYGEDGKEEALVQLLKYGADPNLRYENQSVMHAVLGSGKCPKQLLDFQGLNLEDRDFEGMTLLLIACQRCPDDVVLALLDMGADIHARDQKGRSALHHAQGRLALTKHIVVRAPKLIDQQDEDGRTPLHLALRKDTTMTISYHTAPLTSNQTALFLLEQGADAKIKTRNDETGLHMLFAGTWDPAKGDPPLKERRVELVRRLLAEGLGVNERDNKGATPIFYFFGLQTLTMPSRARNMFSDEGLDTKLLAFFDSLDVDFKAMTKDGRTLLHIVAEVPGNRRPSRFKFLINKGLDPRVENQSKETPLDVAARVGAQDILEWYQAQGCQGNSKSNEWVIV